MSNRKKNVEIDYGFSCGRHWINIGGKIIAQTTGDDVWMKDEDVCDLARALFDDCGWEKAYRLTDDYPELAHSRQPGVYIKQDRAPDIGELLYAGVRLDQTEKLILENLLPDKENYLKAYEAAVKLKLNAKKKGTDEVVIKKAHKPCTFVYTYKSAFHEWSPVLDGFHGELSG